jgi:hypothetical protein
VSLLIDALKKAEQEKKEAAKRLKEAQEKSGEHIKLQSDEQVDLAGPSQSIQSEPPKTDSPSTPEKKRTTELSLSPLDGSTVEHKQGRSTTNPGEEQKDPKSLPLGDVTMEHVDLRASLEDDGFDDEPESASDKTFALTGLSAEDDSRPFDDTGDNTLKDKFANTLSDSRAYKAAVSAAELVKDIGGGRGAPTPVAAQTVFTAVGGTSARRQVLEWTLFLGLFAVVIIAAGTFYYLKVTPLTPEISSPLVAQGVEVDTTQPFIVPLPVDESSLSEMTGMQETAAESVTETANSGGK